MSKTNTIYTIQKKTGELETCIKEMPINSSIITGDKTGGRLKPTYQIDRLVNNYIIYSEDRETEQMTISEVIEYLKH